MIEGRTLNGYAYVGSNPVNYTDPTGYADWGDFVWPRLRVRQMGRCESVALRRQ